MKSAAVSDVVRSATLDNLTLPESNTTLAELELQNKHNCSAALRVRAR